MNRRENMREHNPLWIATFAAFIARGWGSRDAMVATDRALELIRSADAAGDRSTATAAVRRERATPGYHGTLTATHWDSIVTDEQGHEVPA